jgi:hypothetical protein
MAKPQASLINALTDGIGRLGAWRRADSAIRFSQTSHWEAAWRTWCVPGGSAIFLPAQKGFELSADVRLNRYVNGLTNYSWQARPDSQDFDLSLLNLPPRHRFNASMGFDYRRYLGNVSVVYVSSAYWNDIIRPLYSGPTDAYTTVNATGGVRWRAGKYAATLKVANLFNTLIQSHVWGDILKRQVVGELRVRF